jgi:hypothetical protein
MVGYVYFFYIGIWAGLFTLHSSWNLVFCKKACYGAE